MTEGILALTDLALCETATAGPRTLPHLRLLTATGLHVGGGADTSALCGRTVAWDIREVQGPADLSSEYVCGKCVVAFHSGLYSGKTEGDTPDVTATSPPTPQFATNAEVAAARMLTESGYAVLRRGDLQRVQHDVWAHAYAEGKRVATGQSPEYTNPYEPTT